MKKSMLKRIAKAEAKHPGYHFEQMMVRYTSEMMGEFKSMAYAALPGAVKAFGRLSDDKVRRMHWFVYGDVGQGMDSADLDEGDDAVDDNSNSSNNNSNNSNNSCCWGCCCSTTIVDNIHGRSRHSRSHSRSGSGSSSSKNVDANRRGGRASGRRGDGALSRPLAMSYSSPNGARLRDAEPAARVRFSSSSSSNNNAPAERHKSHSSARTPAPPKSGRSHKRRFFGE
jgi:hypothetical protein